MFYIILGSLSFFLFIAFDINKIKYLNKYLNITYPMGFALLGLSTIALLLCKYESVAYYPKPLWITFTVISLILLINNLFFLLPFNDTYVKAEQRNAVVSTGVYSLCRHPSSFWFFLFYLFLWLASGKLIMLWAGMIWTVLNFLYVYVQDRWIFPHMLNGYDDYKKNVPFLLPNCKSITRYLKTIMHRLTLPF